MTKRYARLVQRVWIAVNYEAATLELHFPREPIRRDLRVTCNEIAHVRMSELNHDEIWQLPSHLERNSDSPMRY